MKMLRIVAAMAMAGIAAPCVAAESNTFTLLHKDRVVGKCIYSIEKGKKGYTVKSRFQVKGTQEESTDAYGKASQMTTDVQQSFEYKLDDAMNFVEGFVMDQATRMNTSYVPNKAGDQMTVGKVQQGVQGDPSTVPLRPAFLVAPQYDASVLQVLLLRAMTQGTADKMYWLVLPGTKGQPNASSAQWTAKDDVQATLKGAAVTVHHYQVLAGKTKYELYGDDANTLMLAKVSGNEYVRDGFVLAVNDEKD